MARLTLTEAKTHLNIQDAAHDAELTSTIDVAESLLGRHVGPLESASFTEDVRNTNGSLRLMRKPVTAITSITPYINGVTLGSAVADTTYRLDKDFESISRSCLVYGTAFYHDHYRVVYTAGWSTLPDEILQGVRELVRHLWTTQRGGNNRPGSPADPTATYTLPRRVVELVQEFMDVGNG